MHLVVEFEWWVRLRLGITHPKPRNLQLPIHFDALVNLGQGALFLIQLIRTKSRAHLLVDLALEERVPLVNRVVPAFEWSEPRVRNGLLEFAHLQLMQLHLLAFLLELDAEYLVLLVDLDQSLFVHIGVLLELLLRRLLLCLQLLDVLLEHDVLLREVVILVGETLELLLVVVRLLDALLLVPDDECELLGILLHLQGAIVVVDRLLLLQLQVNCQLPNLLLRFGYLLAESVDLLLKLLRLGEVRELRTLLPHVPLDRSVLTLQFSELPALVLDFVFKFDDL